VENVLGTAKSEFLTGRQRQHDCLMPAAPFCAITSSSICRRLREDAAAWGLVPVGGERAEGRGQRGMRNRGAGWGTWGGGMNGGWRGRRSKPQFSQPREGRQSACHRREPVGCGPLLSFKPPSGGDRFSWASTQSVSARYVTRRECRPLPGALEISIATILHRLTPMASRLPPPFGG
jgi:hypothetical protein